MTDRARLTNRLSIDDYHSLRRQVRNLVAFQHTLQDHTDLPPVLQFCERFLQVLWNEQRIEPPLTTRDGRTVRVRSAGTWNVEGGPDFRNASIEIAGTIRTGDVEIHQHEDDWFHHGHHTDPAYRNVILHVVFEPAREVAGGMPPVLVLADVLDGPLKTLADRFDAETYPYARCVGSGDCAVHWAGSDNGPVRAFLQVAGKARFRDKALRFQEQMTRDGAAETLYRALFDVLGYKANRQAFTELARHVPLSLLRCRDERRNRWALLYGTAGFLGDPTVARSTSRTTEESRLLWRAWWLQGRTPLELPWKRSGTRPANRPERRLAAGILLLEKWHWRPDNWLLDIVSGASDARNLLRCLRKELLIQSGETPFALAARSRTRLLGRTRALDLIANVLLPAAWALARHRGLQDAGERAESAWMALPCLQTNRPLEEACHRLLVPPSRARAVLAGAAEQQGLLEIYHSFCTPLQSNCANCPLAHGLPFAEQPPG